MPSNWLYIDTNFPSFTGEEDLEQRVTTIQNYLFMLVEQFRYTLHNLDLGNMNSTAVEQFSSMLTEPIYARIADDEGNLTQLQLTAVGLAGRISDAEGNITQLGVTAQGLASRVSDAEGNISSLSQTAASLQSQISSANGNISILQQTAAGLTSRVSSAEGSISTLQQFADSLTLSVNNGTTSSTIKLMAGGAEIASQNITMSGLVTYTGLANGTTVINGGCIQTGTIDAEYLNLTGAIRWSDLSSSMQRIVEDIETTAGDASTDAANASNTISDWSYQYGGTTYIDGTMLRTGTVTASTLQGGEIDILNDNERTIGYITVGSSTASGLQLVSRGNLYLASDSCDIQMEDDEISVVCSYFYPRGSAPYLGYSGLGMWEAVYAYTGTIQTSDLNQKNSVIYGLESYDSFFDRLAPISFLFNTGTSGRRHFGLGAQDVEQALIDSSLTSMDFAGLIKSPRLDDEGQEIEGEYDYALRYAEFIPLLIDQVQQLKKRVSELEATRV